MRRRRSVVALLRALVLAGVLPIIAADLYSNFVLAVREQARVAQSSSLALAQLAAAQIEHQVADARRLAAALAGRPLVRAVDPARCDPALAEWLGISPQFANILVADPSGRIVCSALPQPGGKPVSAADRQWFQTVMRTGQFTVGEVMVGRITGRWVSVLAYPIRDSGGRIIGAVGLPLDLHRFQTVLSHVPQPRGASMVIVDAAGTIVARSLEPERWVGRNARGTEIVDEVLSASAGQTRARGYDGVERFYGYARVRDVTWWVYAGIPVEVALAPGRTAARRHAAWSAAAVLLAGVLAYLVAGRISGPTRRLADLARAVAAGQKDARAEVAGPAELAVVAVEFNAMLDAQARAETALREGEASFRYLFDHNPHPMWIYEIETLRFLAVNDTAVARYGYSRQEFEGMTLADIRPSEDVPRLLEHLGQERAAFQAAGLWRHRLKDGSVIDVEIASHTLSFAGRRAALVVAQDVTARVAAERSLRSRLNELEAVNRTSRSLRTARTLEQMLSVLLDETLAVLDAGAGAILLYDPARGDLRQMAARGWFAGIRDTSIRSGEGIAGTVFATGTPHLSDDFASDPLARDAPADPGGWGGACVPLRTAAEPVGVLFVAVPLPRRLTEVELHLLSTLSEMAGNAIHRLQLHQQTERRLEYLSALRTVDAAISASVDLRVALEVLLDQTTSRLGVDAAAVLLLDPHTKTLEFAAGQGFRTRGIQRSRLRLGEGYAGRVALERRPARTTGLTRAEGFVREPLIDGEGFVAYHCVPLVAKGDVVGVLELFQRSPLQPDADWLDFLDALAGQAAIAIDNARLFEGLQRSRLELAVAYDATLEGWSRAMELRDRETEGHTQRVAEMTLRIARALGVPEADLVHLRRGALLHDIGKLGVPDTILLKPGPLTDDEWEMMRRHPTLAYEMLAPISYLRPALDIPYCHHEKWDGTGYPRGLRGEETPLAARIFAVADVFDALTSERPYRPAWTREQALAHIGEQAGKHFDPRVVEVFLRLVREDQAGG